MEVSDTKKHVENFCKRFKIHAGEGGLSDLGADIIYSLGSKSHKILWSSPYVKYKSLAKTKEEDKKREEIYKRTYKKMHIVGKVYLEEIITLTLIYNYKTSEVGTLEISKQKIMKYIEIINSTLEEMGMPDITSPSYCKDLLYQTVVIQGIDYSFKLKDEVLEDRNIWLLNNYLSRISQEIRNVATMPNALEVLGIQLQQKEKGVVRKLWSNPYFKYTSLKNSR